MKGLMVVVSLAWCSSAHADFDAASYPPYERCALCHGLFGQSHLDKFPHLAGQRPQYIRAQLDAFLSGKRTNDGGQMSAIVTELKPEEIPVVVSWFSEQDPPEPVPAPDNSIGQGLTETLGCLGCHDDDAQTDAPHLTAQHAGYLAKQMRDYKDGHRTHSAVAMVHRNLFSDIDTEIDAIAAYLSSQERAK